MPNRVDRAVIRNAAPVLESKGFLTLRLEVSTAAAVRDAFQGARAYFRQDTAQKASDQLPEDLGFRPAGIEYSASRERPDVIESFSVSARWPQSATASSSEGRALHSLMTACLEPMEEIAEELAIAVGNAIGGRRYENLLSGALHRWSCLQMNYSRPAGLGSRFIHELHEDGHLFTIACATGPGLQVRPNDGSLISLTAAPDEAVVMPGEIISLLSGGRIRPLYHCVRPEQELKERLALLFFADVAPEKCEPWVVTDFNAGVDIGHRVHTNPARFGLRVSNPD
jgi:isopenicillin N synthase-like dioxygenase